MLALDDAKRAARRALAAVYPDRSFVLTALKDPTKAHACWVFRGRDKADDTAIVCKLGLPDKTGRAKIAHQYDRLRHVNSALTDPDYRAPQAIAFVERHAALVMEHVAGQSVLHALSAPLGREEAGAILRRSGAWLAHFHAITARQALFDPDPHLNWIRKNLSAPGAVAAIPQGEDLTGRVRDLDRLGDAARGRPAVRCVTHRDFHTGNLLLAADGTVCGLDFENAREDDALRDVTSFLFDVALRWNGGMTPPALLRQCAQDFWQAYGDGRTDPQVLAFFQTFAALNAWANVRITALHSGFQHQRLAMLMDLSASPLIGGSARPA